MRSWKSLAALALALCLCLTGCTLPGADPEPTVLTPDYVSGEAFDPAAVTDLCHFAAGVNGSDVMLTVDGTPVTADELIYWLVYDTDSISSYAQYMGIEDIWSVEPEAGKPMSQFLLEDARQLAASRTVIVSHAREAGIELTEDDQREIDDSFDTFTAMAEDAGLPLEQFLRRYVLTEQVYRDNTECDHYYMALTKQLYGDPSDGDILQYLADSGTYRAQHILLLTVDDNNEPLEQSEIDKQRAKADELLTQIRASSDPVATFRTLMDEYTQDPGYSSSPDGYLAVKDQMVPEFEEAALALKEGEISDVVTTDYGFHIILRCPLDVDPAEYAEQYTAERMQDALASWVDGAEIVSTPACDLLDAKAIYEAVTAFREAVDGVSGEDGGDAPTPDASAPDASASAPDASAPDASAPATSAPAASAAG